MEKSLSIALPLILSAAISAILSFGLSALNTSFFGSPHWPYSIVFYLLLFGISATIAHLPSAAKEQAQKLLVLSVARLLIALVFILVYILKNKTNARSFSMHFIIHFIIFLTLDTIFLIKSFNKKQ